MKRTTGLPEVLGVLAVLAAAGCAKAPPMTQPDMGVTVPEQWTAPASSAVAVAEGAESTENIETPEISAEWWTDFGDASLDAVVRLALEQNRDLQGAAARLE